MLMEHLDAAGAAFEVGYESPSQFSRAYNRLAADQPQPEPVRFWAVLAPGSRTGE